MRKRRPVPSLDQLAATPDPLPASPVPVDLRPLDDLGFYRYVAGVRGNRRVKETVKYFETRIAHHRIYPSAV